MGLFVFHYIVRTFVYSTLIKGGKPMPLDTFLAGMLFTTVNGLVQTYHHTHLTNPEKYIPAGDIVGKSHVVENTTRFVGFVLFFVGFFVNQLADRTLRNLRKDDNDKGYYIPHGAMFKYISAPNLVGEIVEWIGYAMLTSTMVGACFATSTTFIVGHRAIGHHNWYRTRFGDKYPKERCAVIPFVY